jgi:hypothetical protein
VIPRLLVEVIVTAFIAVAIFLLGLQAGDKRGYQRGHSEFLAEHAACEQQRADWSRQAAADALARQEETAHRVAVQEVVNHDTEQLLQRAEDGRAAAVRELDSLRHAATLQAAAACVGTRGGDPAAAGRGAPASAPELVRADLFGWSESRSAELAAALDQAHARGVACERDYAALTTGRRP